MYKDFIGGYIWIFALFDPKITLKNTLFNPKKQAKNTLFNPHKVQLITYINLTNSQLPYRVYQKEWVRA